MRSGCCDHPARRTHPTRRHADSPLMKAVHPEFTRHRAWDSFFEERNASTVEAMRRSPFLPGSLSYHWHNRYGRGIPAGSWSAVLLERFKALALDKACAM